MSWRCPRATAMRSIRAVMAAGEAFGIAPYGTEALGVMRIEKGHVSTNEINGQTTAHDLGAHRMLSSRKDYIGRVMAERPALNRRTGRPSSGFKPVRPHATSARRRAFSAARRPRHRRQRSRLHDFGRFLADARPLGRPRFVAARAATHRPSVCAPTIRCATATSKSKSAIRFSSIPSECASMPDLKLHARAPLEGLAQPGPFGAATANLGSLSRSEPTLHLRP